ncbi:MAG: GNAT family N-acetyltransferase [Ferruginibacter sp.]
MIKNKAWDSAFFNLNVGEIYIQKADEFSHINLDDLKKYDVVYVFTDEEMTGNINVVLVDTKVTWKKGISNTNYKLANNIKSLNDGTDYSYDELLNLAYISGTYSRFKSDSHFNNGEFNKLYKMWLDSSLNKSIAFDTLVDIRDNNLAGFITIGFANQECSQIGLVAVAPNYQGMGIASSLISAAEFQSYEKGCKYLMVATQSENIAAMQLYKKAGFNIFSKKFIYHIWNK